VGGANALDNKCYTKQPEMARPKVCVCMCMAESGSKPVKNMFRSHDESKHKNKLIYF